MTASLNDLEAQIRALEGSSNESDDSSVSDSEPASSEFSDSEIDSFSGYSGDSSDTESSESSEESEEEEPTPEEKRKIDFAKKANQISRKKARLGMSDICFKFLAGKCTLEDCIFRHSTLDSLTEEEKGDLVRELRRKPFELVVGGLVKQLNIPVCKTFSKQGVCKFQKCRFWHIESENDAKWAGSPFWCELCRKAFTSDNQLREHNNGKFHKSNLSRRLI
jgi:hypothetical protein